MSICNEKKYANDVLRHGFISEVLPRLLGISGYVQIPTVKIKRNLPQLWYMKWSQYVNSQPFKIFLILQYYGMCSADQLARHSDYVHGRAFSIYQFTQTLYYLERMSHTDFLICEKSSPLMSILSMFSLL